MRSVDEPLQSVGTAIWFVHRKQRHAIVTPSMIAVEGRNGHQFNMSDAKIAQVFKLCDRGIEGALCRECSECSS